MARQKGDGKGRLGGRAKGTPNKVTAERKARIAQFVEGHWEEFVMNYEQLDDPKEKCKIFMDILPYYAPKLSAVEYKDKTPAKSFKDELDELSGELTREK